jgi:hypothetical protein
MFSSIMHRKPHTAHRASPSPLPLCCPLVFSTSGAPGVSPAASSRIKARTASFFTERPTTREEGTTRALPFISRTQVLHFNFIFDTHHPPDYMPSPSSLYIQIIPPPFSLSPTHPPGYVHKMIHDTWLSGALSTAATGRAASSSVSAQIADDRSRLRLIAANNHSSTAVASLAIAGWVPGATANVAALSAPSATRPCQPAGGA